MKLKVLFDSAVLEHDLSLLKRIHYQSRHVVSQRSHRVFGVQNNSNAKTDQPRFLASLMRESSDELHFFLHCNFQFSQKAPER